MNWVEELQMKEQKEDIRIGIRGRNNHTKDFNNFVFAHELLKNKHNLSAYTHHLVSIPSGSFFPGKRSFKTFIEKPTVQYVGSSILYPRSSDIYSGGVQSVSSLEINPQKEELITPWYYPCKISTTNREAVFFSETQLRSVACRPIALSSFVVSTRDLIALDYYFRNETITKRYEAYVRLVDQFQGNTYRFCPSWIYFVEPEYKNQVSLSQIDVRQIKVIGTNCSQFICYDN